MCLIAETKALKFYLQKRTHLFVETNTFTFRDEHVSHTEKNPFTHKDEGNMETNTYNTRRQMHLLAETHTYLLVEKNSFTREDKCVYSQEQMYFLAETNTFYM